MTDWINANIALVVTVLKIALVLFLLLTAVAYVVWFERKLIAHIQARWGPFRVGPYGLLQPLADGLKFLFKEEIVPADVTSRLIYFLAPFLAVSLSLLAVAVIPFGPGEYEVYGARTGLVIADLNIGLLFVLGVTSLTVYAVALAGWSSNSKYALLGSLRSSAQMVSYELALTLSVVGVLLLAGTLSLRELVHAQEAGWFILPQLIGFVCFFISGVAETNRSPFDLPEAETELVAGFHTEYSSMKFAMFFMAEYAHIFTTSFLATILFFGGWLSPFPQSWYGTTQYLPVGAALLLAAAFAAGALKLPRPLHRALSGLLCLALLGVAVLLAGVPPLLGFVQGLFWFITKTVAFLFVFIWVRATLPRFRYDQLMAFGWKFLVPLATLNIVVTSFVIAWRVG